MRTERGLDRFVTFFLSFALIARLCSPITASSRASAPTTAHSLVANLAWSLTIVLVPFATQVAGSFPPEPLAVLVYTGTVPLSAACLAVIGLLVWRRPELRGDADEPPVPPLALLVTSGALVVALLLGTLFRAVNYWALLLLVLTAPIESWLRRSRRSI